MKLKILILVVTCFFSTVIAAPNQSGYPEGPEPPRLVPDKVFGQFASEQKSNSTTITGINLESEVNAAYVAYFKRYGEVMEEQRKAMQTQQSVYWVIFVVVHIVLFVGIIAATFEYRSAYKSRRLLENQSELKITADGFALKTSLHGTVLLSISIAFYFLYLAFVYPTVKI